MHVSLSHKIDLLVGRSPIVVFMLGCSANWNCRPIGLGGYDRPRLYHPSHATEVELRPVIYYYQSGTHWKFRSLVIKVLWNALCSSPIIQKDSIF